MLDVNQETGGSAGGGQAARQLLDARQDLRRALSEADVQAAPAAAAAYTFTAANEILPPVPPARNPDLVMYVFPHLAGTDQCRCLATPPCSRSTSACSMRCLASAWRTTDGLVVALGRKAATPWPAP